MQHQNHSHPARHRPPAGFCGKSPTLRVQSPLGALAVLSKHVRKPQREREGRMGLSRSAHTTRWGVLPRGPIAGLRGPLQKEVTPRGWETNLPPGSQASKTLRLCQPGLETFELRPRPPVSSAKQPPRVIFLCLVLRSQTFHAVCGGGGGMRPPQTISDKGRA